MRRIEIGTPGHHEAHLEQCSRWRGASFRNERMRSLSTSVRVNEIRS
jgi:hypothetical protein